jgi:hypothetical protein
MATPATTKPKRRLSTVSYTIVAVLLLFIVVALPIAVASVTSDVTDQSAPIFDLNRAATSQKARADVHMQVIGVNEWDGTASIRVSAHQTCDGPCQWGDRFLFVSTFGDTSGEEASRPASETISLAAGAHDVTQVIKLPLFGDPIRYPFDKYKLGVGLIVDRIAADGSATTLSGSGAASYVDVTLQARVPRMTMSRPRSVDPAAVQDDDDIEQYAVVELLSFQRPIYLRILTCLLVLLVTAAAAYAVFLRPLDQLIINSGALVLGVWGIRSILLGSSVPGLTAVDLSLMVVILFLLVTITVRTLWLLEDRSHVTLIQRLRRQKAPDTPPEKKEALPPDNVPATAGGV